MADTLKQRLHDTRASDQLVHPDKIHEDIESTLDSLAHLDEVYGHYRLMLVRWSGSTAEKDRLRAQLEKFHREDRKPLLIRLADLHERLMSESSQIFH
jgi:hypothetical protein